MPSRQPGARRWLRPCLAGLLLAGMVASGGGLARFTVGAVLGPAADAAEVARVEPVPAAKPRPRNPPTVRLTVDADSAVRLTLPDYAFLREVTDDGRSLSVSGPMGERPVVVRVLFVTRKPSPEAEPQDVTDSEARSRGAPFDERWLIEGEFGWTPYAEIAVRSRAGGPSYFLLSGLLEKHEWRVEVACAETADQRTRDAVLAFLCSGVTVTGTHRDPKWTDAEIDERLAREVPDEDLRKRLSARRRTEHFLILGEPDTLADLAVSTEDAYRKIRRIYPFQEVRGRRLLPVIAFPSREDYQAYGRTAGFSDRFLAGAAGHAHHDAWYSFGNVSPDTARHETAHQLVSARIRQRGGGSWWQEGLAEYAELTAEERVLAGRRVLLRRSRPSFAQFLRVPSLLEDERWPASTTYMMAGSVVTFLRDGPWGRERFEKLREAMAPVRWNDAEGADAAFRSVYGISFEDAEPAWRAWATR